ncbi:hypothetical protein TW95_gp1051 [Pandoravirus inopinatum]|uniref:Uncharacterized protein n=1 Tax=Pandoravirus inopinatum TaxID=1605721 RepID=A0A0B5J7E6_9VIRU|nr:hypothetical protein TW95_gp1051 [Pandoravirus inopinatum]AJF97785.1 hypothetical protein [Pandoravirus inopinatum]
MVGGAVTRGARRARCRQRRRRTKDKRRRAAQRRPTVKNLFSPIFEKKKGKTKQIFKKKKETAAAAFFATTSTAVEMATTQEALDAQIQSQLLAETGARRAAATRGSSWPAWRWPPSSLAFSSMP